MAHEPGTQFAYSSGVSQLLSHVVTEGSGETIDKYAREHLFRKIGIKKFYWKMTPSGLPDTEGGLYLTAQDLARIGYLFLHDGTWRGERILPEGWVGETARPWVADVNPSNPTDNRGYGYHWWLIPYDGDNASHYLAALGYGGQYLFVVPEKQIVAVFTGWNIYQPTPSIVEAFEGYVLRSVVR
jgi:CubicO group peptidase (beta-lactamase class C family)